MTLGTMNDDDIDAISELLGAAFAFPPEETPDWLDVGGRENVRVLREGGRPCMCEMF